MLKNFIKFHFQVLILLGQNLAPNSSQLEPLLDTYDLIKRHIVSEFNGFEHLLDKADKKLYSSGRNGL